MKAKTRALLPADFVLAAAIVILFSLPAFLSAGGAADRAVLTRADGTTAQFSLQRDINMQDGPLKIEVKNGKIRVAEAVCPNRTCVHTGWISSPGRVIVCLPNKMIIEIPSKNAKGEIHAVSR